MHAKILGTMTCSTLYATLGLHQNQVIGQKRGLTWMELQPNKQDLGHDKPNRLKSLGGKHEDEPQNAQVDLAIGGHSSPQGYQHHCNYEPA